MRLIPSDESDMLLNTNMQDYTYSINFQTETIDGMCDGLKALEQSIYHILSTQRYEYVIYDRDYGIELKDLIGKSPTYVCAVIKGRIEEALLYDNRIKSVENFEIIKGKNYIEVKFDVISKYGKSEVLKQFEI